MAKRWWLGIVVGVLMAGLTAGDAQAQWPGYGPNCSNGPPGPPCVAPPMPPWSGAGRPEYYEPVMEFEQPTWDYYVNAGWIMMTRQHLYNRPIALLETGTVDDGNAPPFDAQVSLRYSDLPLEENYGVRAACGTYSENTCFEIAGSYLAPRSSRIDWTIPGQLFVPFFNPPLGFIGNNFLWDNADIVRLEHEAQIINGEANMRCSSGPYGTGIECLVGLRYIEYRERIGIRVDDDTFSLGFDPTERAEYSSRTVNHLFGGSLGLSTHAAICEWLLIGGEMRGTWCANFAEIDIRLQRGDGFPGRRGGQDKWVFSHVYEVAGYVTVNLDPFMVRGGYHVMWFVDVAEAVGQVDMNTENTSGLGQYRGQLYWHGPSVSLEFSF
jgi:hypothetical protein